MKKGLILLASLLLISLTATAAVKVEIGGDVNVVFTFEAPNAGFVGLVGDFQGWNLDGAVPMEKDENGVWSISVPATVSDTFLYKFNVDGEWTEDPNAPGSIDDGFGGLNGRVVVADLVGGGDDGPKVGLALSTFTDIRTVTTFEEDNAYSQLVAGSYLKLGGLLMPNMPAYFEIAMLEGQIDLYAAEEVQTNEMLDFLFNPHYRLQNERYPYLGHFRVGYQTEYADITFYSKYAKMKVARDLFYSLYSGNTNTDMGMVDVTKDLDVGLPLTYYVGLTKQGDLRGSLSYVEANLDGNRVQLMYNTKEVTSADAEYFFGNLNQQVALSGRGTIAGVQYNYAAVTHIFNSEYETLTGSPYANDESGLEQTALAFNVSYTEDLFSAALKVQRTGDFFSLGDFYGDNGDGDAFSELEQNRLRLDIDASVSPMDDLTVGVEADVLLDNSLETVADGGQALGSGYKVYADYMNYGAYSKLALDEEANEVLGFKAYEFGAKADLTEMVPDFAPVVYAGYLANTAWNGTDEVYDVNTSEIHVSADLKLPAEVEASLGAIVRLEGETAVANEGDFGFSIGFAKQFGLAKLFAAYGYKSYLFDEDGQTDYEWGGAQRSDSLFNNKSDLGANNQLLVIGAHIEF